MNAGHVMRMSFVKKGVAAGLGLALGLLPGVAATITLTNFDGVRSNPLLDAAGGIASRGTVSTGSFSLSDGALLHAWRNGQIAQIVQDFRQFGNAIAVGFNQVPGMYQDSVLADIAPGDFFDGAVVYTVITNAPLATTPDAWLIYKHGHRFRSGDEPIAPALLNEAADGTLLVGVFGEKTVTLGELVDRPAYELIGVIPEPATTFFVLLSAMAFCWRRRRPDSTPRQRSS